MRARERCEYGLDTIAGVRRAIRADVGRYLTMSPENIALGDAPKRRLSAWLRPELQCLTLYRVSHYLWTKRLRGPARTIARLNRLLHRATISPQSVIGPGCRLPHPAGVTFHGRAGTGLTVFSIALCCAESGLADGPVELGPLLGANVTLGGHATVVGPVAIGDWVTIAYNVAVCAHQTRDVPADRLVVSEANRMRVEPAEPATHEGDAA
jgi:serine O-acetyltransferase